MDEEAENQDRGGVEWLRSHGDVMFRFALLRLGDPHAAEDVVQETLLAAIEAKERFRGDSTEQTWLIGILRHKVIDHLRMKGRQKRAMTSLDHPEHETEDFTKKGFWKEPVSEWASDGRGLEDEEVARRLWQAIERLPEQMRLAICLREIDQLPSESVCKVLGVTTTNLWTLVHRAKLRLRRDLGQAFRES